jgi:hypothetical protein
MGRRFGLGVIAVLGLGLSVWFFGLAMAGPPRGATATDLLGIDLPASAREEQLAVERHGFGEYRAYIRFVIDSADIPALVADPAFQPQKQSDQPLAVFSNASIGDRPLAAVALQARPSWWRPEDGTRFTLVYRSFPGPDPGYRGPDAAWYIINTSDPARAVVHIYVLEV